LLAGKTNRQYENRNGSLSRLNIDLALWLGVYRLTIPFAAAPETAGRTVFSFALFPYPSYFP